MYVHGRSSENKLIPQSNQREFTKKASIIFTARQIDMTGGGPPVPGIVDPPLKGGGLVRTQAERRKRKSAGMTSTQLHKKLRGGSDAGSTCSQRAAAAAAAEKAEEKSMQPTKT